MISTVVALISIWVRRGSGPKLNQASAEITAMIMIVGTNTADTWSAATDRAISLLFSTVAIDWRHTNQSCGLFVGHGAELGKIGNLRPHPPQTILRC